MVYHFKGEAPSEGYVKLTNPLVDKVGRTLTNHTFESMIFALENMCQDYYTQLMKLVVLPTQVKDTVSSLIHSSLVSLRNFMEKSTQGSDNE